MSGSKLALSAETFLSLKGRISRLQFFVGSLIAFGVFAVALLVFASLIEFFEDFVYSPLSTLVYAVAMSSLFYGLICLYAKRLHDLGMTAFWCILPLFDLPIDLIVTVATAFVEVPEAIHKGNQISGGIGNVLALGFGFVLTFKKGNSGPNKYGSDPWSPPQPNIDVF